MAKIEKLVVGPFEISVHFKRMKNIYLRIKPDGRLLISAPTGTTREFIVQFVDSRRSWIESKLEKLATRVEAVAPLGKGEMLLFGQPVKGAFSERQLETLLHEKITGYFENYFPYFADKGLEPPQVKYRTMRSTWGVCRPTVGTITFSRRLVHQPVAFIEYVVLHELCHLIVPNHSRDVYNLVGSMMPNHRAVAKSAILF